MDNIRFLLMLALAFISFSLYQSWTKDYGEPEFVQELSNNQLGKDAPLAPVISDANNSEDAIPTQSAVTESDDSLPATVSGLQTQKEETPDTQIVDTNSIVKVKTDVFNLQISTEGGTILSSWLEKYPVSLDTPDIKFQLTDGKMPRLYIAQSGLLTQKGKQAPTHKAKYTAEKSNYTMHDGDDQLEVKLNWTDGNGVTVSKIFTFTRGSYAIKVRHVVNNQSSENWLGNEYVQFQRTEVGELNQNKFIYTYLGGAIYTEADKYKKIKFYDMRDANLDVETKGGWVGMLQHYFLGAWVPAAEQVNHFYSKVLSNNRFILGSQSPVATVAPGQTHQFESQLVLGPKLQDELKAIAPGLNLSVDYGWLTVLAQPMFWLLQHIHSLLGNWGWSIIILTILIKSAFFKLSAASYKSMANMRKMAPRLQALKDRYGDDKQRMNQAMMDMYKKEKINPLGGCLPMLVQIPFFISLYWVLLESVELRQAPFIFWLNDLSIADPYYVLPLLMGITMFAQQKLNPAPMDPVQAKIMMSLPIVFTVFFAFFPAGLVLYWVVNNLLSITQQWYITSKIVDESA